VISGKAGRRITLGVGVLSTLAMVASFLALTDIAHGEVDLALEWRVLRICALIIVAFHVMAMTALLRGEQSARR